LQYYSGGGYPNAIYENSSITLPSGLSYTTINLKDNYFLTNAIMDGTFDGKYIIGIFKSDTGYILFLNEKVTVETTYKVFLTWIRK
jgi:hypothetical protein